jgi:hypothetical protein
VKRPGVGCGLLHSRGRWEAGTIRELLLSLALAALGTLLLGWGVRLFRQGRDEKDEE